MATYSQFFAAALDHAVYEKTEDGDYFASIPGFAGLWATGKTVEKAREDLIEALEGWLEVTVKTGHRVPEIGGVSLYQELRKVADG